MPDYRDYPTPSYQIRDGRKTCAACLEEKDLSQFHKNPERPDGISRYCKVCSFHPSTRTQHKRSAEGDGSYYDRTAREQKYCCAICGTHQSKARGLKSGRLYFDHSHVTKKRRGLLCHPCNVSLGFAEKRGLFTEKQKEYLDKYGF